jgi:hypothetical protein
MPHDCADQAGREATRDEDSARYPAPEGTRSRALRFKILFRGAAAEPCESEKSGPQRAHSEQKQSAPPTLP